MDGLIDWLLAGMLDLEAWPRPRGLSRPKLCGLSLSLGLEGPGLDFGLGLDGLGLGLGLEGPGLVNFPGYWVDRWVGRLVFCYNPAT